MARHREPIVFYWAGGSLSLGYLGERRWRITTDDTATVAPDIQTATRHAVEVIFRGVPAGSEVAVRAPIEIDIAGERETLYADSRRLNGWRHRTRDFDGDVGLHAELAPFMARRLAGAADRAWAAGVVPVSSPPLAPSFSFHAFEVAADRDALCRQLESALTERMRAHSSPAVAFQSAMLELKAAGHDLWSVMDDSVWGHDYMTPRPGAGLLVTRHDRDNDNDDDDDDDNEDDGVNDVRVEFRPPR